MLAAAWRAFGFAFSSAEAATAAFDFWNGDEEQRNTSKNQMSPLDRCNETSAQRAEERNTSGGDLKDGRDVDLNAIVLLHQHAHFLEECARIHGKRVQVEHFAPFHLRRGSTCMTYASSDRRISEKSRRGTETAERFFAVHIESHGSCCESSERHKVKER